MILFGNFLQALIQFASPSSVPTALKQDRIESSRPSSVPNKEIQYATRSSPKTRPSPSSSLVSSSSSTNRPRSSLRNQEVPSTSSPTNTPSPLRARLSAARSFSGSNQAQFSSPNDPSFLSTPTKSSFKSSLNREGPRLPTSLQSTSNRTTSSSSSKINGPLAAYYAKRSASLGLDGRTGEVGQEEDSEEAGEEVDTF